MMTDHTPTPKLVMGHIEIFSKGEVTVPDNDAVIHIEGDEDSEIEVHCPNALSLAPFIVKAVNAHDQLVTALREIAGGEFDYLKDAMNCARAALASIKVPS